VAILSISPIGQSAICSYNDFLIVIRFTIDLELSIGKLVVKLVHLHLSHVLPSLIPSEARLDLSDVLLLVVFLDLIHQFLSLFVRRIPFSV
jgi:hypothetical protein